MMWLMDTLGWPANCGSSAFQIALVNVRIHQCYSDRTERILQAEEQILECNEEEPDISIRRLGAEFHSF